ncbi:hypothetical protein SLA2020_288810 [Shorea laevis]
MDNLLSTPSPKILKPLQHPFLNSSVSSDNPSRSHKRSRISDDLLVPNKRQGSILGQDSNDLSDYQSRLSGGPNSLHPLSSSKMVTASKSSIASKAKHRARGIFKAARQRRGNPPQRQGTNIAENVPIFPGINSTEEAVATLPPPNS